MVIWMWCLPPMDDRVSRSLRADVSMFRFPTARIYIVCVLASRLLYWVRMFSGLGILVAPRLSTFWVNLAGISSFDFFIPHEEVLFIIVLPLWLHQWCNVYSKMSLLIG